MTLIEGRKSVVIPGGIIGWRGFRVFPTLINGSSQTRKITFNQLRPGRKSRGARGYRARNCVRCYVNPCYRSSARSSIKHILFDFDPRRCVLFLCSFNSQNLRLLYLQKNGSIYTPLLVFGIRLIFLFACFSVSEQFVRKYLTTLQIIEI